MHLNSTTSDSLLNIENASTEKNVNGKKIIINPKEQNNLRLQTLQLSNLRWENLGRTSPSQVTNPVVMASNESELDKIPYVWRTQKND
jgi:hypothetical protein